MIPDWQMMIHPLELCGVLALAASCLLYAFVLHLKVRTLARNSHKQRKELEGRMAQLAEMADGLRAQVVDLERPSPVPARPLNLNKRGQILRMRGRGERPESIAGALGIPHNEVELLIKVHDLALEHVEKGSMPALARVRR